LYADVNFYSENGHLTKKSKSWKFNTAVGRVLKIFLLYFGAIFADLYEIWTSDVESHANRGHVTKTASKVYDTYKTANIFLLV